MIIIKFVGTDAYLMHSMLPHMGWKWKLKTIANRVFYRIADRFVSEIIVDHINLANYLRIAGFKSKIIVVPDPVWHPDPYEKQPHEGFNVLYYDPSERKKNKESTRWIYGVDCVSMVKHYFRENKEINFIKVDGTADMSKIWPITDFYLRPNRSDGASRMVQEAELNSIPVYHSRQFPVINSIIDEIQTTYEAIKTGNKRLRSTR